MAETDVDAQRDAFRQGLAAVECHTALQPVQRCVVRIAPPLGNYLTDERNRELRGALMSAQLESITAKETTISNE